ncbi:MAG: type II toxin-antitoxin system VapC family toxin [Sulfolobales archaeon]
MKLKDLRVKGEIDLAAPSMIYYEVLNALRHSGSFKPEEPGLIARSLEDLQILLYTKFHSNGQIIELSPRYGITVYDASYLSLAKHLNTVVYTTDKELLRKFRA